MVMVTTVCRAARVGREYLCAARRRGRRGRCRVVRWAVLVGRRRLVLDHQVVVAVRRWRWSRCVLVQIRAVVQVVRAAIRQARAARWRWMIAAYIPTAASSWRGFLRDLRLFLLAAFRATIFEPYLRYLHFILDRNIFYFFLLKEIEWVFYRRCVSFCGYDTIYLKSSIFELVSMLTSYFSSSSINSIKATNNIRFKLYRVFN